MTGKLTVSDAATRHLDLWADQLQRGEIAIWQLPLAVQQFISIGWADAQHQLEQQARDYEHKLDLAYLQAYSPKDRATQLQARLQAHFVAEDQRFFTIPDNGITERKAA